jgi:hypothetical protein
MDKGSGSKWSASCLENLFPVNKFPVSTGQKAGLIPGPAWREWRSKIIQLLSETESPCAATQVTENVKLETYFIYHCKIIPINAIHK